MSDSDKSMTKGGDRRTFLKIGAGVVAGAVVAGVATDAYLSSVIGGNNSSSSSTVASLQSQLSQTGAQLSEANGTISSLTNQLSTTTAQLSSTQAQLSSANAQLGSVSSQLTSTQQALTSANAQVSSLSGQVSSLNSQVTSLNSAVTSANGQVTTLQDNLDTTSAFLSLSTTEQVELEAICECIIPSDSTGPGAKEAGAIYFIDRALRTTYGTNGLMYSQGPFIPANSTTGFSLQGTNYAYTPGAATTSVYVPGVSTSSPYTYEEYSYPGTTVTYTAGGTNYTVKYTPTANVRVGAGTRYQYPFTMKTFWTIGLAGIEAYANAAYGGNFENLSAANQTACLTDLWNNKPTYNGANGTLSGGSAGGYQEVIEGVNAPAQGVPGGTQFGPVLPSDFAYELFFMVWNGFWTDPVYGGNKGMVGWTYVGFHGANLGNFYNEGYTAKQLMVMTTPIKLMPASIGQYQKGSP